MSPPCIKLVHNAGNLPACSQIHQSDWPQELDASLAILFHLLRKPFPISISDRYRTLLMVLAQGWLLFEVIFVFFFFIETRGPTLEEIAKIFDGEDAEVARVDLHGLEVIQEKVAAAEVEDVEMEAGHRRH